MRRSQDNYDQIMAVLERMGRIEDNLVEIRTHASQIEQEKMQRIASRQFWIGIVVPATVAVIATGVSAMVTIVFKK